VIRLFRWLLGYPTIATVPVDDLEPYCSEQVLQSRITRPLESGESKAVKKIAARYGAEL